MVSGLILRLLAFFMGHRVNSWWRSPIKNQAVGGTSFSYHLLGGAIDIPLSSNVMIYKVLGYRVVPEPEKNHYHIQTNPLLEIIIIAVIILIRERMKKQ